MFKRLSLFAMKSIILSLVILCISPLGATAQHSKSRSPRQDIRISRRSPTVYITFERFGKAVDPAETRMLETGDPDKQSRENRRESLNEVVWLRLHNNTRWAITFSSNSFYSGARTVLYSLSDGSRAFGLGEGMEISLQYDIEEADGRNLQYGVDKSFGSLLPPGRSIVFSVLREHLSSGRSVYVPFKYEWERLEKGLPDHGPEHRIYFRSSDLP
jgi:hypothetical protein